MQVDSLEVEINFRRASFFFAHKAYIFIIINLTYD